MFVWPEEKSLDFVVKPQKQNNYCLKILASLDLNGDFPKL